MQTRELGPTVMRAKPPTTQTYPKRSEPREDIETLHRLLPDLEDDRLLAVYLRFSECLTIQEISKVLGLTWDETDRMIESTLQNLREGFLAHQLKTRPAVAA